jgi:2-keto-4-pentenoate hydratase/2-oxohepta-3-ene-1,7-dioic acid hydratase in catechol pathway
LKIVNARRADRAAPAVLVDDQVHIIGEWSEADMGYARFAMPSWHLDELRELAAHPRETLSLSGVSLLPPYDALSKIICLGLNYRNHVDETHSDLPENPALFTKLPDVLVGHGEALVKPRASDHFDFEGEIVVVIGTAGRHIAKADAMNHVFGYTIMNDGSLRDYQKHSVSAGKCFAGSGSMGPWIVTADEIPDPAQLSLETRLNGQVMQSTTADLMLYDIPTAIAYISRWTPLSPGDIIATGTPGGVGARRNPPVWMKPDDMIEVEVSSIGTLSNRIVAE